MKTQINSPKWSKINFTSLLLALIGGAAALGVLPADIEAPLTEAALIAGPLLIAVFRTWFTEPKE